MINVPKVIDVIVNNDLCTGCGVCVYKCPSNAIEMKWDDNGFLIPELTLEDCDLNGGCISVCPFNPTPEKEVETENELGQVFLKEAPKFINKIGRYKETYAGFSKEFRPTSSSGGIATYILIELLERGIVDHIFSVTRSNKTGVHYEYKLNSSKKELLTSSKTRYIPVTLATVLPELDQITGKVAIVGVACFIKAIRLAQYSEPRLKEKIPFLVGIICGGIKSRFFTEYLAGKVGVSPKNIRKPEFRIKDDKSTAADYSFGCNDNKENKESSIKMREVGDMWGTGLFKANACDFCDDVTTELADISLGDAWIEPYVKDGLGTNIIITRSLLANKLIQDGIKNKKLQIDNISPKRIIDSQRGSFNHRHKGLPYRLKVAKNNGISVPPKRINDHSINVFFRIVQKNRSVVRKMSTKLWKIKPYSLEFDQLIEKKISKLKKATHRYHYYGYIVNRIKNLIYKNN